MLNPETLAMLRAAIGFLGERGQAGWWPSSFLAAESAPFLAPVFGRTQVLAQCTAVAAAAARVHDERIGAGHVYHLFRLPEDLEQRIHAALHESELTRRITEAVSSRERALETLRAEAGAPSEAGVGPTRAGDLHDLRQPKRWRDVAAQYLAAIERGIEVFPYFADRA